MRRMVRYNDNRQVSPPAPFVHVGIAVPGATVTLQDLPAQLDSAADRSVIPWMIVETLALPQLDELPAIGFGGQLTSVPTFLVELAVRTFEPLTMEVFASPGEPFVLLGRDVLNHFRVILDGPRLVLEIEKARQ